MCLGDFTEYFLMTNSWRRQLGHTRPVVQTELGLWAKDCLSGDLFEAEKPQNTVRSQCLTKAAQGAAITGKKLPTKLVMTIGVPLLLLDLVSIVIWA